jgi:hypothetical protein
MDALLLSGHLFRAKTVKGTNIPGPQMTKLYKLLGKNCLCNDGCLSEMLLTNNDLNNC